MNLNKIAQRAIKPILKSINITVIRRTQDGYDINNFPKYIETEYNLSATKQPLTRKDMTKLKEVGFNVDDSLYYKFFFNDKKVLPLIKEMHNIADKITYVDQNKKYTFVVKTLADWTASGWEYVYASLLNVEDVI